MKTFAGYACFFVALAALATLDYVLYRLVGGGTCASGTTAYVVARPCPAGTGNLVALVPVSIFVALGAAIATGTLIGLRAALLLWAALFVPLGAGFAFIAHFSHDAVVFYALSAMFAVMGVAPFFMSPAALEG